MKKFNRAFVVGAVAVLLAFVVQQSSEQRTAEAQNRVRPADGARAVPQSFESRLWTFLQTAQYQNWSPAPGQNAGTYPGQSPHGAHLKMYLNRTAAADPKNMPHGSIIIKENFGKDKKTLMAVTVMYRSKGFDPQHNDWYWVKYTPDGTVARTPAAKGNLPISGRFKSCIDCHNGAKGNDFVFANDQ